MSMKVAVIGPGALGCLFAARFEHSGAKVLLVDYDETRAALLNKSGIVVESEKEHAKYHPRVVTRMPQGMDLILVLTKAFVTRTLRFSADAPVLTLQNGLGNAEALATAIGASRVLAGSTSEASTWLGPGEVRHAAPGRTVFGPWTTCPAEDALALLRKAGFDAELTNSPGQAIWEKTIMNAGINPLTALLGVHNGALLLKRESRELMRDLVVEATKVAGAEGYRFPYSLVEATEQLCEATRNNYSSMLQDIRNGKRTEITAISGEILRRGEAALLPTPRTRVVYQLVRAMESR